MKPLSTKELDLYEKDEDAGQLMPLTIHLDELRSKILISVIVLSLAILAGFYISKDIVGFLTKIAPKDTLFFQIKPGEFFFSCLRVSLYFGLAVSSPVLIWQLGSFAFPGLKPNEKKIALPIFIGSPILFCLGSLFAYLFVVPSMLSFLFSFGESVISTSISIESYISFTLMIMAICGSAFLMPVIAFALANIGILSSRILISSWRYAIFGSVVLGAILTPTPDPFNMCIISGILIALYFLSYGILLICKK